MCRLVCNMTYFEELHFFDFIRDIVNKMTSSTPEKDQQGVIWSFSAFYWPSTTFGQVTWKFWQKKALHTPLSTCFSFINIIWHEYEILRRIFIHPCTQNDIKKTNPTVHIGTTFFFFSITKLKSHHWVSTSLFLPS